MKTTLTVLAAIVMPGGVILLAIGLVTILIARHRRARAKAAQPVAA